MKILIYIINIYIYFSTQNPIQNGVYNMLIDNLYLYYYKDNITVSINFKYPNTFFRIRKVSESLNDIYYNIEELNPKKKLCYLSNMQLIFLREYTNSISWKIIGKDNNNYIIENRDNCYIKFYENKLFCEKTESSHATQFKIIKIFTEINQETSSYNLELINKTPIDLLIKYIDLRDHKLKREGIFQLAKDYDNEELRYSIRSILNNIPWIRKIFILMPNEKVRYFKDINLINEKIIYIKDKDLLGYDSSNCNAFLFRYWKLKKFGLSDNIIIMDDDYFIAKKLNKNDFFYVENSEVKPIIVTSNFIKLDQKYIQDNYKNYDKKVVLKQKEQNSYVFRYSMFLIYLNLHIMLFQ